MAQASLAQIEHAALRVKEGMTTQQQAHVFHKEGKNYFDTGDMQGALECFNVAISLNPMSLYYVNRAACHKNLMMYTEAFFDYSFAIRLEPESGSLYCHRGLCAAKLDRLTLALEDLDDACRMEPLPLNFYCRASIHAEAGNHEMAIKDLTRVIDDTQHTTADLRIRALHRRGAAFFELRRFEESKEDLTFVCQLDPKHVAPYVLQGKVLKSRGDLSAAELSLDHAITQQAEMHELYVERADIRMRMGTQLKRCEAIRDFDHAENLIKKSIAGYAEEAKNAVVDARRAGTKGSNRSAATASTATSTQSSSAVLKRRNSAAGSSNVVHTHIGMAIDSHNDAQSDFVMTLADVLNKRAQAKLLLEEDSARRSALADALESIKLCPQDEFYKMVSAVCYQRLGDTAKALALIENVLTIHPHNSRALFHQAFCRRESGDFMGAIESLTKIIAHNHSQLENGDARFKPNPHPSGSDTSPQAVLIGDGTNSAVPLAHVFEMRGAIFHGMKAYVLSVKDLGMSIALDGSKPEPYFLRGDCHSRLGNYEQSLDDFKLAEDHGFRDNPALLAARGAVRRLLGKPAAACRDFDLALDCLRAEADRDATHEHTFTRTTMTVRLRMFIALCLLDQQMFEVAHRQLLETLELSDSLGNTDDVPANIQYRLRWTILYHDAMSFYMRGDYARCALILQPCVNDLQAHAPDPIDVGAALFFCAMCESILGNPSACLSLLNRCLDSEWVSVERQLSLCLFARGKSHQRLGKHEDAIADFTRCIEVHARDAYALFRRAWSHKAVAQYELAALDFEQAKAIRFDDPNFSVQYKLVHDVDYMEVESEPDLMEPFPTLLPLPGIV